MLNSTGVVHLGVAIDEWVAELLAAGYITQREAFFMGAVQYYERKGYTHLCYVAIGALADRIGVSRRWAKTMLNNLVAKRCILVQKYCPKLHPPAAKKVGRVLKCVHPHRGSQVPPWGEPSSPERVRTEFITGETPNGVAAGGVFPPSGGERATQTDQGVVATVATPQGPPRKVNRMPASFQQQTGQPKKSKRATYTEGDMRMARRIAERIGAPPTAAQLRSWANRVRILRETYKVATVRPILKWWLANYKRRSHHAYMPRIRTAAQLGSQWHKLQQYYKANSTEFQTATKLVEGCKWPTHWSRAERETVARRLCQKVNDVVAIIDEEQKQLPKGDPGHGRCNRIADELTSMGWLMRWVDAVATWANPKFTPTPNYAVWHPQHRMWPQVARNVDKHDIAYLKNLVDEHEAY